MSQQTNLAARRALVDISRRYAATAEVRKADGTVRHKCFFSHHSIDAEEVLAFVTGFEDVFIPRSVGVSDEDGDIIDSDDTDYVMDRIRTKYLADTTVTIVLIGRCTWARKYIDWEVYSSLRRSSTRTVNGLMAVTLPSVASYEERHLPGRVADNGPRLGPATVPVGRSTTSARAAGALQRRLLCHLGQLRPRRLIAAGGPVVADHPGQVGVDLGASGGELADQAGVSSETMKEDH